MEWRTFIEQLMQLPVTVRTTKARCLYQIHPNPRHAALMADLVLAVADLNRRALRRDTQRLEFEFLAPTSSGSGP